MIGFIPCCSTEALDFDRIKKNIIEDFVYKMTSFLSLSELKEKSEDNFNTFKSVFTITFEFNGYYVKHDIEISQTECIDLVFENVKGKYPKEFIQNLFGEGKFPTLKVYIMSNNGSFMYGYCVEA